MGRAEIDLAGGENGDAVAVQHANDRTAGGGSRGHVVVLWLDRPSPQVRPANMVLELRRREPYVAVEVGAYARDRHTLGGHREQQQDDERQARRGDGEPPADGQPVESAGEASHLARNTYPEPR